MKRTFAISTKEDGILYRIRAKNTEEVRHWIINHLDISLNYTITANMNSYK